MNFQTQDYYRRKAAELARRYDGAHGGIAGWFDRVFLRGSRDLNHLLRGGWDGWGVEPCRALIDEAERLYPAVRGRIRQSALPALEGIGDGRFDGVVASAVLMHLAERQLKASLRSLRRVLRGEGRLLVSLPVDEGGKARRGRDEEGRFFSGLSPEGLEMLLAELGFACMAREQKADGLGRKDRNWAVQLFEL